MSPIPSVELRVYPDDCDSFGHVNQATFLRLFERARWEAVAMGPGIDLFKKHDAWPAVRKTTIEYYAEAFPGDVLCFETDLKHIGTTSFSLNSIARRRSDEVVVAEAELVFVCMNRHGKPTKVPTELSRFISAAKPPRPSQIQRVDVRGVETGVDIRGDGPVILFVHGFPLDRTMWQEILPSIRGWRRVAPDLRGLGRSGGQTNAYSMADYADDLASLLDFLDCNKAVVCGLSMGGYVAFEFLRRHRDRVKGLMLLNTRAEADTDEGRRSRDELIAMVTNDGVNSLSDVFLPKLLAPGSADVMPTVVEKLKEILSVQSKEGVVGALEAMKNRVDSTPTLATIEVPTLVVAGEKDQLITIEATRSMASAIPGAQFTIIPDAGHLTPLEQPVALGRVLMEFLGVFD